MAKIAVHPIALRFAAIQPEVFKDDVMKPMSVLLLAPLLISAREAKPIDGLTFARFGRTVSVDGPRVTPLVLLEDSRCPQDARCIWAGQLRIRLRIDLGRRHEFRDLTLGGSDNLADGRLEFAIAIPTRKSNKPLRRSDYRFGFRFSGGL
jgi:hypothetical protein